MDVGGMVGGGWLLGFAGVEGWPDEGTTLRDGGQSTRCTGECSGTWHLFSSKLRSHCEAATLGPVPSIGLREPAAPLGRLTGGPLGQV